MPPNNSKMDDTNPSSKIIGVQFSMLSPDEIRKNSVVEVTSRDTYINNKPVVGGLFDPRMGVLEPGLICPTDGLDYMETPGYFGHIVLAKPIFHIHYLKYIINILQSICWKCSKLLIDASEPTFKKNIEMRKGSNRFKYVLNHCNFAW